MKKTALLAFLSLQLSFINAQTYDTLKTFILPNQYACGTTFDSDSNQYVVASGGVYISPGDHRIDRYDLNGQLISSTPQNNSNLLGYREIATDGNFMYGGYGQFIYKLSRTSFAKVDSIPGPQSGGDNRGLAVEKDGSMWTSDSNRPLFHITSSGTVISSCLPATLGAELPWGLAVDTLTRPGKKFIWISTPGGTSASGIKLIRYKPDSCKIDTVIDLTAKAPGYTGTLSSAGLGAGLDIINNHPGYPGKIIALFTGRRNSGNSYVMLVDITPDTPTSVRSAEAGTLNVKAYPNPFVDRVTLDIDWSEKSRMTVSLYNMFGQEVRRIETLSQGSITLERDNLPAGLYLYSVSGDGRLVQKGKLLAE